ncbi:MAG: serine/threonine-protein kinase, partial [Gemmatimonadaceae bacterium]
MVDLLDSVARELAGRYDIREELGHGAMAFVYLAGDHATGQAVAIKVLRPELTLSIEARRFHREIELLTSLHHPNILPLLASDEAGALLYYVMPFVPGETLRRRLDRDGALPLDAAVAIARDVASAIDYAHARGVVHRDIKPENILLDGAHALVCDFGVARAVSASSTD